MKTPIAKEDDEFYVGYLPTMPVRTASFVRKLVVTIGIVAVLAAILIVINQRSFSTASFEFGESTTLKGTLILKPVPHLDYKLGSNRDGDKFSKSVLLVGSGKFGVDKLVSEMERKYGMIDKHNVSATGFLIYGDGRLLLQVNEAKDIIVDPTTSDDALPTISSTDQVTISGEIVDPKCFFGVMKPGEGKAHRDCAIRCISGGIPAVLKGSEGKYYLLVGEEGQSINREVLSLIGDQTKLNGTEITMNDWKLLRISRSELNRLAARNQAIEQLLADQSITFCTSMNNH